MVTDGAASARSAGQTMAWWHGQAEPWTGGVALRRHCIAFSLAVLIEVSKPGEIIVSVS